MAAIKVRFAPSPTGYLHVGGARTALFNWLFARHHGGEFILRIEDTDQVRSTPASVDSILEGMRWMGLEWDGDLTYQSQRLDLYNQAIDRLISQGDAYRCVCTQEELEVRRAEAVKAGLPPRYDRLCRDRAPTDPNVPHVVRFRCPDGGTSRFEDLIHGPISFENETLDDFVLRRTDGLPTYNFAVVVDDADLGITHVIRGDEHISNTPRQLLLYAALGLQLPHFAHIPIILAPDKTKLSKRHGAVSVMAYAEQGYLSEAFVDYLARLGWAHGDQEIFGSDELKRLFTLDHVNKTPAVFDIQKLQWVNTQYLKNNDPMSLVPLMRNFWQGAGYDLALYNDAQLAAIIVSLRERSKTLVELAEASSIYFFDPTGYEPEAVEKVFKADTSGILASLADQIGAVETWNHDAIEASFRGLAERLGIKAGQVIQPARLALTGKSASPGMFEVVEILGKERTVARLRVAAQWLQTQRVEA